GTRADGQVAAGASRDRKLTRQPEVEGIDGLDAQPARILCEPPAALLRARERPGRELPQAIRLSAVSDFATQGPENPGTHLRRRAAGEGDREDLLRFIDHREESQQSLREHRGLA